MGKIMEQRGKTILCDPLLSSKAVDEDSVTDPSLKGKYSFFYFLFFILDKNRLNCHHFMFKFMLL